MTGVRKRGPRIGLYCLISLGVAGLLVHLAWVSGLGRGELDGFVQNGVYNGVEALAALACLTRAAISPRERRIWLALGSGLAFWVAGDIYWSAQLAGLRRIPYPSAADAFYVAGYPCFYAGVLMLVGRKVHFTASTWIDGIIGGLASAALGAALLAPALLGLTHGDPAAVATNLAYPLGDILLLSFLVAGVILAGGRLGGIWVPIGLGLATTTVADGIYLYQDATGTYGAGYLDSLWLIGSLLVAAAALAPEQRRDRDQAKLLSIFFPALFGSIAVGVLAWDQFDSIGPLSASLAVATLCVVVVRMALSSRENASLLSAVRDEAITDALTGLGNRRAVMRDLERALDVNAAPSVFAMFDLDGFKSYNDAFGHPAGDLLLRRMGARLADAVEPYGRAYRLGGDEFCVIAGDRRWAKDGLTQAHLALSESGDGFHITASSGAVEIPSEAGIPSAALRAADSRMYARKGLRPNSAQRQTHDVLLRILREVAPDLSAHLTGVAGLAVHMGRCLRLDPEELDALGRAAELHDVGKVAIPDPILHKPSALDEAEWELMRSHTVIGERILMAAPAMAPVARLVRACHEHWDGRGYPDGLAGEQIPLGSRVILICDAFEAITTDRPYRRASSASAALDELRRCAGTQFDPKLVALFIEEVFPRFELASTEHPITNDQGSEQRPSMARAS